MSCPLYCLPSALSQKLKKADKAILDNLEGEIHFLADDKMEGRRAGTNGEKLASDYIIGEFQKVNLQPKGDNNSWLQSFVIYDGKQVKDAHLVINNKELLLDKEFFPLAFSAVKTVEGSLAIALQESGVPWFIDIKDVIEPNISNRILISTAHYLKK